MRKKADRGPRESTLASGWTVEAEPAAEQPDAALTTGNAGADPLSEPARTAADGAAEAPSGAPQLSNGALVLLGVIGGIYLLYTWVWFSWANYYAQVNSAVAEGSGVIGAVLQQIVFWAAPLAPALWFLAAYAFNRSASTWRLALWLVLGGVVLVPLPALIVGGAS